MKKIRDFLHNLGLTETEINIYVKLLELGKTSVSEMARNLEMNRVTAHFTIQGLIDKGLITHVKEGRSRELTAQPPEALQYLIEKKDKEIKSLHEQFTGALPFLSGLMPQQNQTDQEFDVKFYHGLTGVKAIYREIFKTQELRAYVNVTSVSAAIPENYSLFPEASSTKKIKMREIIEDSEKSREYVKKMDPINYSYRFFPEDLQKNIFDYLIFEGKIAMISGAKEINGIVIVNDNLYKNAKALFDMLWHLLPNPKP